MEPFQQLRGPYLRVKAHPDPVDTLGSALESMRFVPMAPDELIGEDELEIVSLLQLGWSSGLLDLAWTTRLGRAHTGGLRLVATAWTEASHARSSLTKRTRP